MRINLIYGILGFILGGLITFFVFTPETTDLANSEGSMGVNCPGIKYTPGQIITSECTVKAKSICTFEDRGGCEYIMRNLSFRPINQGDTVKVVWFYAGRGGSSFLGVELPLD